MAGRQEDGGHPVRSLRRADPAGGSRLAGTGREHDRAVPPGQPPAVHRRSCSAEGSPGDLIEAGAWRGGATIFLRASSPPTATPVAGAASPPSFQGLPRPDPERFPAEAGTSTGPGTSWPSRWSVQAFARYGLLDDRSASCPAGSGTPCRRLPSIAWPCSASTATCTAPPWTPWALYPKLSPGGYVIIDDYGNIRPMQGGGAATFAAPIGIIAPVAVDRLDGRVWQRSERCVPSRSWSALPPGCRPAGRSGGLRTGRWPAGGPTGRPSRRRRWWRCRRPGRWWRCRRRG